MITKKTPTWILTLSTFIGLFICRALFERSNFALHNFSDRTIGIAVLQGINISSRSIFYVELIAIFMISFFVCFSIFSLVLNIAKQNEVGNKDLRNESNALFTLSTFSIFILVFHYINGAEIFVSILNILKLLICLSFATLIVKIVSKNRYSILFSLINNYNIFMLSFLLPLVVFFIRWIFVEGSFTFTNQYLIPFLVLWIIYWIVFKLYFLKVPKKIFATKIVSVLLAAIPLLLIPLSAQISNEIQYSLSGITSWSEKSVSIVALLTLLTASFFILLLNRSKNINFKFAKNFYLPIFIATITVFNMHTNFLDINYLDMFHHGENLISTQQLFSFGKIPFINIYPTHGISYMVGQVLYSLANGYQPFAPWLWEWIAKVFEVVLLYFVITKITNSFFSACLITFLPIIGIFGGQALIYGYTKSLPTTYYFAPFLIGLILIWALKNLNFKSMLIVWFGCLFMAAWRVDFGIASFISAGVVVFISIIESYFKNEPISEKLQLLLKGLTLALFIGIGLILVLSRVGSESFAAVISQIMEFVKFQGQVQGLPQIIASYSPISIFQYLILPLTGVFYVLYYLYKVFTERETLLPKYKTLLLYIAIFSLVISVRSLQRQTLAIIGYNPYLFAFLLLSIPLYVSKTKNKLSNLIFVGGLLTYQLVLPNAALLLKTGQQVVLYNWHNKENRVHVDNNQYKDVVAFLNSNLEKNQTFLDLSSSPLLYVVSDRKFINYLIPNAYYTSEVVQKNVLDKISSAYNSNEIPIVIFRQSEKDANNIDGVPNEIRSYRVYEFIYTHYHPVGYVKGYSIWISNGYKLKDIFPLVPDIKVDQQFNLQKLPYIWGNYDTKNAKDNTKILESFIDKPMQVEPLKQTTISINKDLDKTSGNYLHFKIQAGSPGSFTVIYGISPISQVTFDLIQSGKPEDYLIRISSQYYWTHDNTNSIRVSSSVETTLTEGYIRKGD